jgi:hypothetical protein
MDDWISVWTVVELEDVPPPHNLFRDMNSYREVCWYTASCDAADALRRTRDWYDAVQLVKDTHSSGDDQEAVLSFFTHPVTLEVGHPTVTNGQHRCQAMREQGIGDRVLALVDRHESDSPLGEEIMWDTER